MIELVIIPETKRTTMDELDIYADIYLLLKNGDLIMRAESSSQVDEWLSALHAAASKCGVRIKAMPPAVWPWLPTGPHHVAYVSLVVPKSDPLRLRVDVAYTADVREVIDYNKRAVTA